VLDLISDHFAKSYSSFILSECLSEASASPIREASSRQVSPTPQGGRSTSVHSQLRSETPFRPGSPYYEPSPGTNEVLPRTVHGMDLYDNIYARRESAVEGIEVPSDIKPPSNLENASVTCSTCKNFSGKPGELK